CPYSALKIYHRGDRYTYALDLPQEKELRKDAILEKLKTGPYGRCVYKCDNNVADHQVVSMQFEKNITAGFNMEAFTNYHGRRTRIMGSMGCLVGDENVLTIGNFITDKSEDWITKDHASNLTGHGGGDFGLMRDFLRALDHNDASLLSSTLEASMDSHRMGFAAEESRLTYKMIDLSK
ncbi:MAG: hypothetical protein RLZZ546_192, partial [Bacteroidota bacterium]